MNHALIESLTAVTQIAQGQSASAATLADARCELTDVGHSLTESDHSVLQGVRLFADLLELTRAAAGDSQRFEPLYEFVQGGLPVLCEALSGDVEAVELLHVLEEKADDQWKEELHSLAPPDEFPSRPVAEEAQPDRGATSGPAGEPFTDALAGDFDEDFDHEFDEELDQDFEGAFSDEFDEVFDEAFDQLFDEQLDDRQAADDSQPSAATPTGSAVDADDLLQAIADIRRRDATAAPPQPRQAPATDDNPSADDSLAADNSSADGGPMDPELLEAFQDDAQRCLATLEQAALALEADSNDANSLQQIGRELHTLKGAAASVGLNALAADIHMAEETLLDGQVDADQLLARLDGIRNAALSACGAEPSPPCGNNGEAPAASPPAAASQPEAAAPSPATQLSNAAPSTPPPTAAKAAAAPMAVDASVQEGTQRIRTAQLDRLMDMLAGLVMLRNHRQSGVEQLSQVHFELTQATRHLRRLTVKLAQSSGGSVGSETIDSLCEVSDDLGHSLRMMRDFYEPLERDNESVSQFIGQFRHELAALRRMPVSGLFHRLRRVARDAARVEGKQVQLQFHGGQLGLEPVIQERLYEPLLHIVRNAVSHGIESPEQRSAAGKPNVGTVTLSASGGGNLVQLEIHDDGGGLNYEAIRRRAVERGLLAADRPVSHQELAQLIFHPGFSTREGVNEVAGRGVGMDVVASTLEQLRGWIEVSSQPGDGTKICITLPLPSVIQHVMVFRVGQRLFALPMQCLQSADDMGSSPAAEAPQASMNQLLGVADEPAGATLWLHDTSPEELGRTALPPRALTVADVVGPEEVVVRPLPALLQHHPLFSGTSLSGSGDTLLLIEPRSLSRLSKRPGAVAVSRPPVVETPQRLAVLVVDDSRTARLRVARQVENAGFEAVQAADGAEALELLKAREFVGVFTDLEMPGVDGFELLAELQASGKWSHLPVIVASTLQSDAHRQQTAELGASAHLAKPVDEDDLKEVIGQLLPSPKLDN